MNRHRGGRRDFRGHAQDPAICAGGCTRMLDLGPCQQRLHRYTKSDGEIYRHIGILGSSDSLTLQNRSEIIRVADLLPGTV